MKKIHGGDIYTNKVNMDFSVNVNPFGIPKAVKQAMQEAVDQCDVYPDISCYGLSKATAGSLQRKGLDITEENMIFGNGASEIFMAVVHALKPKKAVIPVPSFYGYEYAVSAAGADVIYHDMYEKNKLDISAGIESLKAVLTDDIDLLFLAAPNNPTGDILEYEVMEELVKHCMRNNIYVVVDECFIDFCEGAETMLKGIGQYENLMVVRAFTKIFAIPGVRLGYLVTGDCLLKEKIQMQLPEWNVSVIAQQAGIACAMEDEYVRQTVSYIAKQREYMEDMLGNYGFVVYKGSANFILFRSDIPLYDHLLRRGILIRDCSNYRGLSDGYYRIAVRTERENQKLMKEIGECIEEYRTFAADGDRKAEF